ncbi:ATP-binding oligopeptide/dipeptide ABC transporter, C-terminal domain protein [Rhodoferax antarcticus ANT.BR]|uniref:ATP-binding oligopeptide/dipeptide ABC transporter, C-terminal domain protein n=1 Tax=Rhodoferax antarcticus ANT.BR TaxID=1111071 RepID=A0A1Q8YGU1_9BURK|nr:ATP-binding oligopeptide/dipeptide ABC transporter, C-terminal domain protein [Rhodoferax antarcticus ANT.BR]
MKTVSALPQQPAARRSGGLIPLRNKRALYADPRHPYTQALLSAIPIPNPELERGKVVQLLQGDLPSPMNPPSGCVFRTRCPKAQAECAQTVPELHASGAGLQVACLFA